MGSIFDCIDTFDAGYLTAKGKRDQAVADCATDPNPLECRKQAIRDFEDELSTLANALLACIEAAT